MAGEGGGEGKRLAPRGGGTVGKGALGCDGGGGSWKLVLNLIALLVQKVQIVTRPKALLAESLAARAVTLMLSARV